MISITPLYAGILAILMAVLSTRVGVLRGKLGVALGDGGQDQMALSIRRFGNLSEYLAMALLLLLLMELRQVPQAWLHAYGVLLVLLRLLHPIALFSQIDAPFWKKLGRGVSAAGTAGLIMIAGLVLIAGSFRY